ncbi:MAG TPA: phenylalanine--tRNA ligase subunit alpha, partial [Prolixibacteraceae bacterium]|nr:phenylalanine--tRNA ligase subunit alpha [Prolixibacteraceae bacterium]
MLDRIKALQDEIAAIVANNKDEAEALRIKYLSKKGKIGDLFGEFKNVPVDQKKAVGAAINDLKNFAQDKINSLKASFDQKRSSAEGIDLSLPGDSMKLGSRHPLAVVRNEIIDIFARLGFVVS